MNNYNCYWCWWLHRYLYYVRCVGKRFEFEDIIGDSFLLTTEEIAMLSKEKGGK